MCAWIFKSGILSNSPVLTCCCVFFLNKWTCFIFTRSLLLRCTVWIRIIHGLWRFLAASRYINIICMPRLCAALCSVDLLLHTQGNFYWFPEGLHAGYYSSLESHFHEWAFCVSLYGASHFLWPLFLLVYSSPVTGFSYTILFKLLGIQNEWL